MAKTTSRPRTKKPAAAKPEKASRVMKTAARKSAVPAHPPEDKRRAMIAEAAYYLAEKKEFRPEHNERNWLEAENQINAMLAGQRA